MKKLLIAAVMLLSYSNVVNGQTFTAYESRRSMSSSPILVADETTYTALKDGMKIISANKDIVIGLMSKVEGGITKYVVEQKKNRIYGVYLQYTLWINNDYSKEVVDYFNSINKKTVSK